MMRPIAALAADLADRRTTSRALVEACLDRIADPAGEGGRVFLRVDADAALAAADAADLARAAGRERSPYAGIPVSVKALFDVAGTTTTAGSKVLADAAPAEADADAVRRLKAAGFVIVGATNMTEFAYSGLGINGHYGTPKNAHDRAVGRIPGGSSSGAAVSVTDGMAAMGLGTDTGGSCRIPAALNGITGFKPTARRVPTDGAFPLSTTLDSVGPLAPTAACCAALDAILAGETTQTDPPADLSGVRLAVLENYVMDGVSSAVAAAFQASLAAFEAAGAEIGTVQLPDLDALPALAANGGIIAAEAYALHSDRLATSREAFDPRISVRIMRGASQPAGAYEELLARRREAIATADAATTGWDALVMPTTPVTAPTIAELDDEDAYGSANLLLLRNPTVTNFLDRCAISLPAPMPAGNLPVGIMLMGARMADRQLLAVAQAAEAALARKG